MKQEMLQNTMTPNTSDTKSCAHVDDLVAYLYGETSETEALDFQTHLTGCSACRAELSQFADVRGGISAWRDEALHPIAAFAPVEVTQRVVVEAESKRSALLAVREFFTLSPFWLRGATAFAAVLLVALLVVTTARFFESSESQVVKQAPSLSPAPADKSSSVQVSKDEPAVATLDSAPGRNLSSPNSQTNRAERRKSAIAKSNRRVNAPDLSKEERSQLSDLLIAANEEEESVPRLYDLLNESN